MTAFSLNESTLISTSEGIVEDEVSFTNCSSLYDQYRQNSTGLRSEDADYCDASWKSMLDAEEHSFAFGGPPWWLHLFIQILYGVVCLVGLTGNTMVIYVVMRFAKMQTVTNLYIVNLAIADELFLIGIPFLLVTSIVGYWPFGKVLCKAYFISTSINQITSSLFLLIMSADRYLAVCHPINAPKYRTPLIAKIVAASCWTISAILMVPIFMYTDTLEMEDNKTNCNILWPKSETMGMSGEMIFIFYSFLLGFLLPFLLIVAFYILVIVRLRKVGPKRRPLNASGNPEQESQQTLQQNNRARERKKSHRKVTKLVLTVITVYFICWVGYWITQMYNVFKSDQHPNPTMIIVFFLVGCLSYSNSAMNPILYAFLSDNFKKSFKKACSCGTNKDYNNTINNETSIFPRRKGSSYRRRKHSAPMTSATFAGTTFPEMTMVGTSLTRSTILNPSNSSLHQESPPLSLNIPVSKLIPDIEESDNDSGINPPDILLTTAQNTYTAILVHMNGAGNKKSPSIGNGLTPNPQTPTKGNLRKTSFSDLVNVAPPVNTFVQDNGVVVTAL